jgi:3-oxoacyl-[acyl-carrier protein] reductase
VLIVPTTGVPGSAGLVPYTTAVEGIRAMAESAARQWAGRGQHTLCTGTVRELEQ